MVSVKVGENPGCPLDGYEEIYPDMLLLVGYDRAFIGVGERCGQPAIAIYDHSKIVDILMDRDGMDYETAIEFISFNVAGGWVGEGTPMILYRDEGTQG